MLKIYVTRDTKKELCCLWGNLVRRPVKVEQENEFSFFDEFICWYYSNVKISLYFSTVRGFGKSIYIWSNWVSDRLITQPHGQAATSINRDSNHEVTVSERSDTKCAFDMFDSISYLTFANVIYRYHFHKYLCHIIQKQILGHQAVAHRHKTSAGHEPF
jgi:hypothetical protein